MSKRLRRTKNVTKIVENSRLENDDTENLISARTMIDQVSSLTPPPPYPPSSADETSYPINYSGWAPPPTNLLSSANNDIEKNLFAVQRELISTTKSQKTQTGKNE